ncbi:hypothetical protein ETU08_05455 [Apibacter muscae]|uniref:Uncharacterized protein n=1 Tax=Apibacter muscae TaxID=2509004 RepID=A0A563DF62_9FLAO|nr:hypothetical protein [Apibacter muscae]TWP24431.1 hypothetical protein ETU10_04095 [Apibacter muscae]TWP28742.1 hypothetical protein ETU09_05350 [Apibacter muscae]TWP30006.1 hypothetical protein ETU08_05455 [Apibacter muscae]
MCRKKFSLVLFSVFWGLISPTLFSQIIINSSTKDDLKISQSNSADLILNSLDKSFMPNRVALISLDSPLPLAQDLTGIQEGTIVYNISDAPGLSAGLHVWQDSRWNILLTKLGKRQDYSNLVYLQTGSGDNVGADDITTIPYVNTTSPGVELAKFTSNFTVPKNGNIMINALIYVQMYVQTYGVSQVANTFFTIQVTDITPNSPDQGKIQKFYTGCTPISMRQTPGASVAGINNNPTSAIVFSTMRVTEGHSYEVKVLGQEGWNSAAEIKAGTFQWRPSASLVYNANSVLKIDFQSDPY